MPFLKEDIYTIDDIMNLPDGQRAELIDGKIYDMAPPSPLHQEIAGELFAAIHSYLKSKHGPCKPYLSPIGVFLSADENTSFVEPDLLVVCDPSKITKRGCEGAPDFIIEVVSPVNTGSWIRPRSASPSTITKWTLRLRFSPSTRM